MCTHLKLYVFIYYDALDNFMYLFRSTYCEKDDGKLDFKF